MTPSLALRARIDPVGAAIHVQAILRDLPSFFLNSALQVTSCTRGGVPVEWSVDAQENPFLQGARHVVLGGMLRGSDAADAAGTADAADTADTAGRGPVTLEYEGVLPAEVADGANTIDGHVCEIGAYTSWFPVPPDLGHLDWTLEVTLPAGWRETTNGVRVGEGRWRSIPGAAVADVVVVASPDLEVWEVPRVGVEVVTAGVCGRKVHDRVLLVGEALELLTRWYGPLPEGTRRVVFCDRGGFPYSRMPTVLMPVRGPAGEPTEQLPTLLHEISHFWWSVAPVMSAEDWINEALAEYSALRLLAACSDLDVAALLERCREAARADTTAPAIRDLPAGPEASGVNRYRKGPLFLQELADRMGGPELDGLLRDFHRDHRRACDADTDDLLARVRAGDPRLGAAAATALSTPAWDGEWPTGR